MSKRIRLPHASVPQKQMFQVNKCCQWFLFRVHYLGSPLTCPKDASWRHKSGHAAWGLPESLQITAPFLSLTSPSLVITAIWQLH